MSKISILVAVYNAAEYLRDCLDSLLGQTFGNIEVICVDDASTDNSWAMLQDYAARDSRITALHMDVNRGQAVARNIALKHSTGDYVTCLDADDWMAPDALEKTMDVFGRHADTDCVLFDVRYVGQGYAEHGYAWRYPKGKYRHNADGSFVCMPGHDAFLLSLTWQIHGWYVLRGDIFRQIPFDDSCRHFSDDNTTRAHFRASREVRCCGARYYYRQVAASVTHVVGTSRMDYMKANASMKRTLEEWGEPLDVMAMYEHERWKVVVDSYMFYFKNRSRMSRKQTCFCLGEIRKYWASIDTRLLRHTCKPKLGYVTFRCTPVPDSLAWLLFRTEEEAYFTLKRLVSKI